MKINKFNDTEKGLYTMQEVCTILRISYPSLLKYVRQGKIKAIRTGNKYKISEKELRRILNEGF